MVEILCAGQQTEEDLRRFAVLHDNDRYVGSCMVMWFVGC